jgi:hypothetical protein
MKTLYAFYDLAVGPVSFDVMPFLMQARIAQQAQGCDRLHFVVVPDSKGIDGQFRDKSHLYDAPEMHWRLWNIVVPACRMAGGTVSVVHDWAEAKRLPGDGDLCWPDDWTTQSLKRKHYLQREVTEYGRAGGKVPLLQPLAHARRAVRHQITKSGKPLVTLTMRNTYEPARNADQGLWQQAYEALRYRFHVVRIFDTSEELVKGYGYGALNLELRAALYAEAVQNFHCHGGPVTLNWYLDAPYVLFGAAQPHDPWMKVWIQNVGLQIGEQFPWARPDQRLRYDPCSDKAMAQEIQRLAPLLKAG